MTASPHVYGKNFNGEYFLRSISKYFVDRRGESPGRWLGSAAKRLGLPSIVARNAFRSLLAAKTPDGLGWLTHPVLDSDRTSAIEICLSPPKSVTADWVHLDAPKRKQIERSLERAAIQLFRYAEQHLALGRRGRGGRQREFVKLVYAAFLHTENRNGDPQLHLHCVFPNIGLRKDGTWCALNSRMFFNWARTLGPMFNTELVAQLQKSLAVTAKLAPNRNGTAVGFELTHISPQLIKHWSSRSADADRHLAGKNGDPELVGQATAKARHRAVLKTRQSKKSSLPLEERLATWRNETARLGLTPPPASPHVPQPSGQPKTDPVRHYQSARRQVLRALLAQEASFGRREFITRICEAMQHRGVSLRPLLDRIDRDLASANDLVRLQDRQGQAMYTNLATWSLEERLLKSAKQLHDRKGVVVSQKIIDQVIAKRPWLQPEQERAIREILSQRSGIRLMTGVAGAGKSVILDAIREALQLAGYRPLGGALSGVATEELAEKAHVVSRTIASYLWHTDPGPIQALKRAATHEAKQVIRALAGKRRVDQPGFKFSKKDCLILDEMGMVDSKTLDRLLRQAKKHGLTVIGTGDVAQIQPIGAGAPFQSLVKKYGASHLAENQRQVERGDRAAVLDLRAGQGAAALANYDERDRLQIAPDRHAAIKRLVNDWARQGGIANPSDHAIFVTTRADAKAINDLCQQQRIKERAIGARAIIRIGDEPLHVRDRVLFHKPLQEFGIRNGYQGTVITANPLLRTITIRLDKQPQADHSAKRRSVLVTIPLSQIGKEGLKRNYAMTIHRGQGMTVNHSYLLIGGRMTDREITYTQATRGRLSTRIYTDAQHAGPGGRDLAESVSRSNQKLLAHDLGLHLQIEQERRP